jgi:GYF domain 2
MNYWVSRGGQQYGPYSLADLQRYVASGNILATDMARSEGMNQWLPVSQILSGGGAPAQQPPVPQQPAQPGVAPQNYGQPPIYSQPPGAMAPQPVAVQGGPLPPGMHWALVLLIGVLTCGIFIYVWLFIQASFVKKLRPASNVLMLYAIGVGGFFAMGLLFLSRDLAMLAPLINIGCAIALILGHFQMKAAIEDYYNNVEPLNLRLSGVMVFFFNVLYFQYHFTRIREWKTTGVWR